MRYNFTNEHLQCTAQLIHDRSVQLSGKVNHPKYYKRMELIAPAPIDRRVSYSGSGLPFPCAAIALDGTPNHHEIQADGSFSTTFAYPNSYYSSDAAEKIPPSVFVVLHPTSGGAPNWIRFELPDDLPVRTLTHRAERTGPEFYAKKDDIVGIQGAEATMYAIANAKIKYGLA